MVVKDRPQQPQDAADRSGAPDPSYPFVGRSVRVVGDWRSVDANQTPHEKNKRGELGKLLSNWYFNRISRDPLGRIGSAQAVADRRNLLSNVVGGAPKGQVNPRRAPVHDPKALTKHIKRVGKAMGADIVGIAAVHPSFLYAGGRYPEDGTGIQGNGAAAGDTPEELAKQYPFAITLAVAWNDRMVRAHRHRIGDAAYHISQQYSSVVYQRLVGYIRELGYSAVQRMAHPMPVALAGGIGEMGRHGMLITADHGPRIHPGDPILTDLPLIPNAPIDIGVEDFCRVCKKCATTCPTNSITIGGKAVSNGVEKYKINWETCYRLRPHVMEYWESCLTCVAVCPYTKPKTWWHTLAVQSLKRTPIPLRSAVVWPLKWLDDRIWGKIPQKRVQWMSYDSGLLKLAKPNAAASGSAAQQPEQDGKGHYYPLKENTRRFDILKEKRRARV